MKTPKQKNRRGHRRAIRTAAPVYGTALHRSVDTENHAPLPKAMLQMEERDFSAFRLRILILLSILVLLGVLLWLGAQPTAH